LFQLLKAYTIAQHLLPPILVMPSNFEIFVVKLAASPHDTYIVYSTREMKRLPLSYVFIQE